MFSRYKKTPASGAQPVKAPVPAAPVATQPAAQPSAVRRKARGGVRPLTRMVDHSPALHELRLFKSAPLISWHAQ